MSGIMKSGLDTWPLFLLDDLLNLTCHNLQITILQSTNTVWTVKSVLKGHKARDFNVMAIK